jgi:adenosine deaminase
MLINLHSHLEGRMRPETAAEIASGAGLPEPAEGWHEAFQLAGPADLTVYLAKVAASYPFFAHREFLSRIAREAVEDAAADGLDYLELRFGPSTHVHEDFGLDEVIAAVCEGVADGSRETGLAAGVVVAALRHLSTAQNTEIARAAARFAGRGIVGFDLAGDELIHPELEPHREPFAIARAAGLGLTCHAAEAAPGAAAREAVELFGVTRIGHGAHVATDAAALAWIADSGIAVEICPTSNWYTGAIPAISAHPAPVFREAGVRLVLGDDNPVQTMSPLSAERRVLHDQLGFDEADLHRLDEVSIEAAFLDDSTRSLLRERLGAQHPA